MTALPRESATTPSLDSLLALLDDGDRRSILRYLLAADDVVPRSALVDHLEHPRMQSNGGTTEHDLAAALHHVHLPMLASADVVEFVADRRGVRYTGGDRLERLLEVTEEMEAGGAPG
ncbi:hypothetical protein VB773_17195 [Haloarculaceae archaeon H-GB2-1]|nr:hypothetical protein [Haloarculaceae archaeon H-GB1-1]MEA5387647.1 hypothetical protein [Haloarculaceae archaeon H-GB11]MEA5409134.1 hypothetical protein [Haloarculaceae archaeon H-GB2-1]